MRRLVALVSALAMALLGVSVATGASPTNAVVPGVNGRIVFTSVSCGDTCTFRFVTADPDGTTRTVVAGPYGQHAFDDHSIANWSPDGTSLIFMAHQAIWQVNADGTGLHKVFRGSRTVGMDDGPTFTPDGEHIVFSRCCPNHGGQTLWMINTDGTGLEQLTRERTTHGDAPADTTPQVSPDGTHIVFNRCFPVRPCVVSTVTMNGRNRHRLSPPSEFGTRLPNWSPSSRRVVFTMATPRSSAVAVVRADGSHFHKLTHARGKSFSTDASYSPDGTKIIFARGRLSRNGVDLFTMHPDGTRIARVTDTKTRFEILPQWAVS